MTDDLSIVIYDFIKSYIQQNGYSPNLREIAKGCHVGRSTASRYLDRLEAKGRITRIPGHARSISLRDR
jgi:repressor LexA